jgi:ABC-2 type transport system ATP-binding protein
VKQIVETFALSKKFHKSAGYRDLLLRPFRREEIVAVKDVTLQVQEGELFGLLGPNGAGKTTLIKMLCTLILPSGGRAQICGRDIVADAAAVRPLIGLVDCQERSFFWRLSGRQNLEFFAALQGLHGTETHDRIDELLDLVGLNNDAEHRFMSYSTGMRQRLAVARGLLSMPRVIFMDEPTRSLDPVTARELRAFIRRTLVEELKRTVVLVTHRLEEAEELCDRVAIMNHGQIITCGSVEEIKKQIPARQKYRLRVRHLPLQALDGLRAIPGIVRLRWVAGNPHSLNLELVLADEKKVLPSVMSFIVSQKGDIQHCQAQNLSLEEAFVHLIKGDENET